MEFVRIAQVTQKLHQRNLNAQWRNAMKGPLSYMMEVATNVRNTRGLSVRLNVVLVFAHPNKNCWKMVHVRTAQIILEVQVMEKNVQLIRVMSICTFRLMVLANNVTYTLILPRINVAVWLTQNAVMGSTSTHKASVRVVHLLKSHQIQSKEHASLTSVVIDKSSSKMALVRTAMITNAHKE